MRKAVQRSRHLRKNLSLPEGLLWREIRALGNPIHLRRQFPVGGLTVDFACREARLVIEIDGEAYHVDEEDANRDTILSGLGYTIRRIPARDVLRDPEAIAEGVVALCREHITSKQGNKAHPVPSPAWRGKVAAERTDGGESAAGLRDASDREETR